MLSNASLALAHAGRLATWPGHGAGSGQQAAWPRTLSPQAAGNAAAWVGCEWRVPGASGDCGVSEPPPGRPPR